MFRLPAKTPTEIKLVTFDFSSEAAAGATLSSPTVDKATYSGTDPGAASLAITAIVINGQFIEALIGGGLNACEYELIATATASNGEKHQIIARLPVATKAA